MRDCVEPGSTTNRPTVVFTAPTYDKRAGLKPEDEGLTTNTHFKENHGNKRRVWLHTGGVCGAVCKEPEGGGLIGAFT